MPYPRIPGKISTAGPPVAKDGLTLGTTLDTWKIELNETEIGDVK